AVSFLFAVYKNFTAIDIHTVHETKVIEETILDTHKIENFVENFAEVYYSWEHDTVRKDIPVSSALTDFQIWEITEEKEQHYQVTYTVEQHITEGESVKTVRSAYQVTVYVDGSGNLTIIQNPTITSVPVKSGYTPKAVQSDGTVDSITTEEINEFLTTFFKLYPTATAKELTYYVNEGVLKPVGKEYIFSELVNPVYNRNGNQVTASLAVKYLDNQTMTTQVSQFDLVLEKNGENWKIVK
uniref:conjugal transfer protein n=1 Tax=Blautia massiliensis (ex Durand et al. 2017) TaxID=1737424 RepID=UPI0022E71244